MEFQTDPPKITTDPPQPKPQPLPGTVEEAVPIQVDANEDDSQKFQTLKRLRP